MHDQWRESLERLVEQDEPRFAHEGARDRQHLLLAAGKIAPAIVTPLGETRKHLVGPTVAPGILRSQSGEGQILVDSEAADDASLFRHKLNAKRRNLIGGRP